MKIINFKILPALIILLSVLSCSSKKSVVPEVLNCPKGAICTSDIIHDTAASLESDEFDKNYIKLIPSVNQKTLKLTYKIEQTEGIADSQYVEEIYIPLNKILKTNESGKKLYTTAYYGILNNYRNGSQYKMTEQCAIRIKRQKSNIYLEIELEDLKWNKTIVKLKS
ncbi:MAG: hypothetical protein WBG46_03770 [Nonlabens sp.]